MNSTRPASPEESPGCRLNPSQARDRRMPLNRGFWRCILPRPKRVKVLVQTAEPSSQYLQFRIRVKKEIHSQSVCKGHGGSLFTPGLSHKSATRGPVVTTVQLTEKGQSSKHAAVTRLDIITNISHQDGPGWRVGKSTGLPSKQDLEENVVDRVAHAEGDVKSTEPAGTA